VCFNLQSCQCSPITTFGLGLYSGIFAVYLIICSSNKFTGKMTSTVFYGLCILYILSTVTYVIDFVQSFYLFSNTYFSNFHVILAILQTIASGLCDFVAQCIMIYRCWIVWNKNIHVVIIPSFLAIAYIATWLASDSIFSYWFKLNSNSNAFEQHQKAVAKWFESTVAGEEFIQYPFASMPLNPMIITSFVLSMAVNTMMTGLIVLKILRVFSEVKATTGGTKFRHIIFIIIESGMALFAVQMVRVVISCIPLDWDTTMPAFGITTGVNQMFNGIAPTIILVRVSMRSSIGDNESFKETVESICFNNPASDPNLNVLDQEPVGSMQLEEIQRSEETSESEE